MYRQVKETLLQGNKNVSSAAAASALLFARQAERAAKYHQEAGEKDYTAQDYLMQIVADAQGMDGTGLSQAKYNAQVEAVRQQYEGTDKWMKAPNGKQTNLTERQWLQVRTPAFKAWFGDWENDPENASKVVDENGEPLVVYHGTAGDFNEFDRDYLGSASQGLGTSAGFFFAIDKEHAEYWADNAAKNNGEKPRIIEAFLNIREPLNADLLNQNEDYLTLDDVAYDLEEEYKGEDGHYHDVYDGALVKNLENDDYTNLKRNIYIVKYPDQIKSATANNGNFSLTDDNIYLQEEIKDPANMNIFDMLPETERKKYQKAGTDLADEMKKLKAKYKNTNKAPGGFTTVIQTTPDVFLELNVNNKPIVIKEATLLAISQSLENEIDEHAAHRIYKDILTKIPVALCDPIIIMDNVGGNKKSNKKSLVAWLAIDMKDEDGSAAKTFVALSLDEKANHVDAHLIKTIHPRPESQISFNITKAKLEGKKISYVCAKIKALTGVTLRRQLPQVAYQDSASIRKRIAQKYEPVNDNEASTEQKLNQDIKGAYSQAQNLIALFQAADQSTFMHESAHAYLEDLRKLAEQFPESQAAKDYATIMAWAQWKEGDAAAYAGTASAGEFAKREAEIKETLKNGFVERTVQVNGVNQEQAAWLHQRVLPDAM